MDAIVTRIKLLKKQGWKVKFVHGTGPRPTQGIVKFRANMKHINLRGHIGYADWKGIWHVKSNSKWVFEVWKRNENGGYNLLNESYADLEEAIARAVKLSLKDEPIIPTWKRDDLPEAFKLPEEGKLWYTECGSSVIENNEGKNHVWVDKHRMKFQNLVQEITCLNVVSITKNCLVTVEASVTPGNRAWFLLECWGSKSKFLIITDGEEFYPAKKVSTYRSTDKYKIQLSLKILKADLGQLNKHDSKRIRIAIKHFANEFANQFTEEHHKSTS